MNKNLTYFLIAIRNASIAKKNTIKVKKIKNFEIYMNVLYKEGLIQSYSVEKEGSIDDQHLIVQLRCHENRVLTSNIKSLSTPSKTKIFSYDQLAHLRLKNKRLILSTSKGIVSDVDCLKKRLGGTAMFIC